MYRIDLHTHSVASPDGGISAEQYKQALANGVIDMVAITDHDRIDFALGLKQSLGDKIIVGEEITTTAGEIIGLFLSKPILPGLSPNETIRQIKSQRGLVYIPHPFETIRKGLRLSVLEELLGFIDIIEVCNGRAFLQNRSEQAVVWARLNHMLPAASSDAHGIKGLGKCVTIFNELPTSRDFLSQIANAKLLSVRPGVKTLLYPRYNRLHKKLRRHT